MSTSAARLLTDDDAISYAHLPHASATALASGPAAIVSRHRQARATAEQVPSHDFVRPKTLRRMAEPEPVIPARPFVKWAGGKRQLLQQLTCYAPRNYGTYFEPFVGGGALFYELAPRSAYLSDANERLIRTYRALRDDVDTVISLLRTYPYERGFFEDMRKIDIDVCSDTRVAAWFIYLNKTAFNGLYRVNRSNRFNVPFGSFRNPCICDEDNLRACSRRLQGVQLGAEDFTSVLMRARAGDFVYFDPPYMPISESSSFVSYTKGGFGPREHEQLRDVALALKHRGVTVLVSNSAHPYVKQLYEKDFNMEQVLATRAINSNAAARGAVCEYLIS